MPTNAAIRNPFLQSYIVISEPSASLFILYTTSMACIWHLIAILSLFFIHSTSNHIPEGYVVYMGSNDSNKNMNSKTRDEARLQMLSLIIPREEKERMYIGHSYSHAFKGFSAMLTEKEAEILSKNDKVVKVFPDRILQLHTTRSWDFLEAQSGLGSERAHKRASSDIIIGLIDTGVWPESPSFYDTGMGPIPSRWKGVCMEGPDFKKSNCNRKLIGARYYNNMADSSMPLPTNINNTKRVGSQNSPRDSVGHGTHTSSTAAGTIVPNADYYGLAQGTAKGGCPRSRLAMYKACSLGGCAGSAVLKAMDDAVGDGVDIISVSIGMSSVFQSDFLADPIALGAFHANQKGVVVVCSGGNDGPEPYTVVNSAPWIFTVGASSIDRSFQSDIVLGNGEVLKGIAINFSNLTRSQSYPLIFGRDAAADFTPASEASNCYPGSLDIEKTAGKIVVCVDTDPSVSRKVKKLVAEDSKAKGLIVIDETEKGVPFDSGSFPFSEVGNKVGVQILDYINSTTTPTASILGTKDYKGFKPAPIVAYFSARGPGGLTEGILKPDIIAPGIGILAAAVPIVESGSQIPNGKKISNFAIKSGTSMACPHVAGAVAFVRSAHPKWSPSMIRSALMTTTTISSNLEDSLTTSLGSKANYHDMGSGEISPLRALSPGLVFDTTIEDYLHFLCYYGYENKVIRSVSDVDFTCPNNSTPNLISNVNYPSISVAHLDSNRRSVISVPRTVTNVGPANSTYTATVEAPNGFTVSVWPNKLYFGKRGGRASYEVKFEVGDGVKNGYGYGSVMWSDGAHLVRTVFAVNVV